MKAIITYKNGKQATFTHPSSVFGDKTFIFTLQVQEKEIKKIELEDDKR